MTRFVQEREESRADLATRFRVLQAIQIGNRGTQELRCFGVEKTTEIPEKPYKAEILDNCQQLFLFGRQRRDRFFDGRLVGRSKRVNISGFIVIRTGPGHAFAFHLLQVVDRRSPSG